jgi:hypothetical protein
VAGSIDRRIQKLEELYADSEGDEERAAKAASREQMLERFAQDFDQRVARLKSDDERSSQASLGGLDLTELRRQAPMHIAAVYVVLTQRGEHAMAEAVKDLYEDVKEERRQHPASVELEEWAPGIGRWHDSWFWEMVERHAQSLPHRGDSEAVADGA